MLENTKSIAGQATVEPGEEVLLTTTQFKNKVGFKDRVVCSIDGGSTQTRGLFFGSKDLVNFQVNRLSEVFTIPSPSISVGRAKVPNPNSNQLVDNMHSVITALGAQPVIFTRAELVRATLMTLIEGEENRLGSQQKTTDPTFYYNILDFVGNAAMLRYGEEVPEEIDVCLGISLPPDDRSEVNIKRFENSLSSFVWENVNYGVRIKINFTQIHHMTEPEAYIKAYYLLTGKPVPEHVLHLDGGGRSTGVEILRKGRSLDDLQATIDFGGTHLLNAIDKLYRDRFGGRPNKRDVLETAVRSGVLALGEKTRLDIVDIIKEAKTEKAREIFSAMKREVFDIQTIVSPDMISSVSVSGRFFDEGEYNYSIAEPFQALLETYTPNAEFIHIKGSYIPQGLFLDTLTVSKIFNQIMREQQMTVTGQTPPAETAPISTQQEVAASAEEESVVSDTE